MTIFDDALQDTFLTRGEGELYSALRSTYDQALSRKLDTMELPYDGMYPVDHAKWCCITCQQSLLHRALYLFKASMEELKANNIYAMTICIRGHYEATAPMGHSYRRILSLLEGNIDLDAFRKNLFAQMMGSREIDKAPSPINILTMIQGADKILNKYVFDGKKKNALEDDYNFLCEFAHPNFHSHNLAMRIDRENNILTFRHDEAPRDEEFNLIGYIDISNGLFLELFDRFGECVDRIGA